ncbi:MAG TPA: hypothetical protein VIM16_11880 [Mucilaginibacter sp.]
MATLLNILKNKNGLPYDYSLSHHQLLFITFIYATNMEIVFTKSKQNDIFVEIVDWVSS